MYCTALPLCLAFHLIQFNSTVLYLLYCIFYLSILSWCLSLHWKLSYDNKTPLHYVFIHVHVCTKFNSLFPQCKWLPHESGGSLGHWNDLWPNRFRNGLYVGIVLEGNERRSADTRCWEWDWKWEWEYKWNGGRGGGECGCEAISRRWGHSNNHWADRHALRKRWCSGRDWPGIPDRIWQCVR